MNSVIKRGWEEAQHQESPFQFGRKKPQRFFVKEKDTKELIFSDDVPSVFSEHTVWLQDGFSDRKKPHHYTCIGDDCPLCLRGNKPQKVFCLTAIDTTPWVDRSGQTHNKNRVLYVATLNLAPKLKRLKEKHGGLARIKFLVKRSSK